MNLQDIFYSIGIIAMILFIVLTVLSIYLVFLVQRVVKDTERRVVSKLIEYTKPVDVLKGLSSSIIGNVFLKLRDNFMAR